MKKLHLILLALLAISINATAQKKNKAEVEQRDLYSDTWVATDAIGRTMPTNAETGDVKNDKRRVVGIFYIT